MSVISCLEYLIKLCSFKARRVNASFYFFSVIIIKIMHFCFLSKFHIFCCCFYFIKDKSINFLKYINLSHKFNRVRV
jgi:hypothetical protein